MVEIIIFDPVSLYLRAIATLVLLISAILYISQGVKRDKISEKALLLGFASLFIGNTLTMFFDFFEIFFIQGSYSGHFFYGELQNTIPPYEIFRLLGYIGGYFGYLFFFLGIEISIKRTKFILTFIEIALIIVVIVNVELHEIADGFNLLMLILILFLFSIKSSKKFQLVSIYMLTGFMMIILAIAMNSRTMRELNIPILSLWISSIFLIIGALIAVSPIVLNPEHFRQPSISWKRFNWIVLNVFNVILFTFCVFMITVDLPLLNMVLVFIGFFFSILLIIYSILQIKNEKGYNTQEDVSPEKVDSQEFLKMFVKPQKVTEEEVTISKERKTCLVCKGKVKGFNFICNECGAFYCEKCVHALIEVENTCWVCEAPFDKTKPMKLPEKKIKKPVIEEKIQKKDGKKIS